MISLLLRSPSTEQKCQVSEFKKLLRFVQDSVGLFDQPASDNDGFRERVQSIVSRAHGHLQGIDELVEYQFKPCEELDKRGRPKVSRTAWFKKKDRLSSLRQHLQNCLSELNLAVSCAALAQGYVDVRRPFHHQRLNADSRRSYHEEQLRTRLDIQEIFLANETLANQRVCNVETIAISLERRFHQILTLPGPNPPLTTSGGPSTIIQASSSVVTNADRNEIANDRPPAEAVSSTISASRHPRIKPALCFSASVNTNKCPRFCRCQCHIRTQLCTPYWMRSIIGSFFGSFIGYPFLGSRPCNYVRCQQTRTSSTRVLYVFPAWFAKRAIVASSTGNDLSGPGASWTFRMPRLRSSNARIWNYVANGSLSMVREAFEKGEASPYDVSNDGRTLLHVRVTLCGPILLLLPRSCQLSLPSTAGRDRSRSLSSSCHL